MFDVLGKVTFDDQPLRDLLLKAIRYGDQPEVRARLNQVVDKALDRSTCASCSTSVPSRSDSLDARKVQQIREEMERAEARRLQPHFIAAFFLEAFALLGGRLKSASRSGSRSPTSRPSSATATARSGSARRS